MSAADPSCILSHTVRRDELLVLGRYTYIYMHYMCMHFGNLECLHHSLHTSHLPPLTPHQPLHYPLAPFTCSTLWPLTSFYSHHASFHNMNVHAFTHTMQTKERRKQRINALYVCGQDSKYAMHTMCTVAFVSPVQSREPSTPHSWGQLAIMYSLICDHSAWACCR